ncbi:hypothetical protein ACH5RR_007114 [Cinchona calisaya]|uniref:Pentatricopeptide repeat-containing protein n=1 Tax=Cinchona calisaya TaxID=153742 RepID=A0ABD3AQZ5_9GENT
MKSYANPTWLCSGLCRWALQGGEHCSSFEFLRGQIYEARNVFDSMVSGGVHPNVLSYNILINGYFKKNRIDDAMHLLREMSCKRITPTTDTWLSPDVVTYNTVIKGLCLEGLMNEAKDFFNMMEESGTTPNEITYNILVHGLLKREQYDDEVGTFASELRRRTPEHIVRLKINYL